MGRAPCCDKANVKKGPWSPEEDEKLKHYIQTHGTGGNWIALPKKADLRRCGKSCRLRWLNYLRPNIKHGEFSDDEDKVICDLFARIGSRWSVMAAQLPGRTDNDIKNYWNTKLKKRMMNSLSSMPEIRNPNLHYLQSTFNSNSTNYTYPSLSVFQTSSCNVKINNAQLSPPMKSSSYMYSTTTDHQTLSIPSSPSTAIAVSDHTHHHNHHHHQGYLGLGQMESYQGVKDSSTPVMFSGDQASSSSNSDGSCQYTEYGSSVTANTAGGYEYDQKNIRSDSCYREFGEKFDHKEKGYYGDGSLDSSLEEIKQLISTNLCSSNIDNNLIFFVEETKDVEKVMMYY